VVAIYSTFLQRAYDQLIHDVALQKLPVTFALDRGGLVGADGKTHQGAFDLGYLRAIPGLVVMAPSDENELRHMLRTALALGGPAALRFPRRAASGVAPEAPHPIEVGRARWLRPGGARPDVVIAAAGTPARAALAAASQLAEEGIDAAVLDARFVKPLDAELVCAAASAAGRLVTVEESALACGFGSACLEALADRGLSGVQVARLGLPDTFVSHGDAGRQLAGLGIDVEGIAAAARGIVEARRPGDRPVAVEQVGSRTAG
jgi:1-deoxy-D-xylulose-5-phosphate synthase